MACLLTGMKAQTHGHADNLVASLLTCSPGTEIYQYYGHSALRIRNTENDADFVFNYGIFDFSQPHFIWRFVLGNTDYCMATSPTAHFLNAYQQRGSAVRELVLDLSQEEIRRMVDSLTAIERQPGWTYRYNFFCDNCATRIRDQIAACLDGKLEYTTQEKAQTLRNIVHQYSEGYDWSLFGQDLLIGAAADTLASRTLQQFAPIVLEEDLRLAVIQDSTGKYRPLVKTENVLVAQGNLQKEKGFPLSPLACCMIWLALALVLSIWDFARRKASWGFDFLMLVLQGLAGCLIAFMVFFSKHPTVNNNWLIAIFNPLPLLLLFHVIRQERNRKKCMYHEGARWWYMLFLCATPFIPQYIGTEVILLALSLFTRSMSYHLLAAYRFPHHRT
ncbi:MAG: DUF4105 domain-containing protein [Bacteroidaceae bacterium]|nr:DUF4105 domain-containing protein [Bacteroidaceae bacterium]